MEKCDLSMLVIESITSVLTLITIIVGIRHFNKQMRANKEGEILSRFKDIQIKQYVKTGTVIGYLITADETASEEFRNHIKRFWQLYYIELSAVEDEAVAKNMKAFGDILKELEIHNYTNYHDKLPHLKSAALNVANAIRLSSARWELPTPIKRELNSRRISDRA